MQAMYGDSADILKYKNGTLSEIYWNETSTPKNNPYSYSKMIAEREAWKMAKAQHRWDLVVVNPGLVIGPSSSPESASGSLYMLEAMYRGENRSGTIELHYPIADVRDVAEAHVKVGETPTAEGRYIIAGDRSVSLLEMANFVRPIHAQPSLLPTRNLPKLMVYAVGPFMGMSMKWVSGNIGIGYKVDNSRSVQDLKIAYRLTTDVLRDHYTAWASSQGSS
ncbi:hypothetical protein N0V95_007098 [Ascochyta clinopodiicola]|nr:hypothetical protein N0V95_007098 [Ascochyta clinopodiicola]